MRARFVGVVFLILISSGVLGACNRLAGVDSTPTHAETSSGVTPQASEQGITTPSPFGATATSGKSVALPTPSPQTVPSTVVPTREPSATASPTVSPSAAPSLTRTKTLPALPSPANTATVPAPSPTPTAVPLPPSTASAAPLGDPGAVLVKPQLVVDGLDTPIGVENAGDGSGRLFIVEKPGRIRIIQDHVRREAPFLDITERVGSGGSEQGLLGLAFHPSYSSNGLFFVNYTNVQGNSVISRFSVSGDPAQAEPSSEMVLFMVNQPAPNHNGGHLAFGPDGYLYVGMGDGGGAADQYGHGQNSQTFLGAMVRLDVDGGMPFSVPPSNPFVADGAVRDEIWALGLRNPWRYGFDRLTGDLYIADVGQNRYEEVNVQPAGSRGGENYGWPIMEGLHCFPEDRSCDKASLTLPVQEYDHSKGCSITGGHVYRGQEFPQLYGIYLFSDYCSGTVWGMAWSKDGDKRVAVVAQTDFNPTAFGEDESGEIYLVNMGDGTLYKLLAIPR